MAGSVTNPEQARQDLAEILSGGRVEISDAIARMAERGHPAGRTDRARRALEVEMVRQGPPGTRQRFYWRLPTTCPNCMRPFSPDDGTASVPWDRDRDTIGDYWRDEASPIEPPSHELSVQPTRPPPLRFKPAEPPRCNVCGKASASDRGEQCPWQSTTGQRCPGVMT